VPLISEFPGNLVIGRLHLFSSLKLQLFSAYSLPHLPGRVPHLRI
jgi:hypothetical protein